MECANHKVIQNFLDADHQRLDSLYWSYRQHKDDEADMAEKMLLKFADGLTKHITWEESHLFPCLETHPDEKIRQFVAELSAEHQVILSLVNALHDMHKKALDSEKLELQLEQLFADHTENEEMRLYPICESFLQDEQLKELLLHI